MTVLVKPNGLEEYPITNINPVKQSLMTNEPVDDVLHVISVISNHCHFRKRTRLVQEFLSRMAMGLRLIKIINIIYNF